MQTYLNNNRFIDSYSMQRDYSPTFFFHYSKKKKMFISIVIAYVYFRILYFSLFFFQYFKKIFFFSFFFFSPNHFTSSCFGPEFGRLNSDIWMRMHTHTLANYHTPLKVVKDRSDFTFLHRVRGKIFSKE